MLLSIVIVEYNSVHEVERCVKSLTSCISLPFEVVVSSNSCYDAAMQERLKVSCQSNVRWLFNRKNGGFAYAMNQGLKVAHGDYLVIMNSDCLIDTDLKPLVEFMQQHQEIGAAAPQLCDTDGEVQDTARPYVTVPRLLHRNMKRMVLNRVCVREDEMDYTRAQSVDWLIGAFIMVSREAYERVGGLDERYFMYAEDIDWCTRIHGAGLDVVYYPHLKLTYRGTRRARKSLFYARIFFKSHWAYWRRFGFFFSAPSTQKKFY